MTEPVICQDQLNPQPGGVTVTLAFPNDLKRDDGSPSQAGDVLSVQPDGSEQARPAGANGAYELATILPAGNLLYRPGAQGFVKLGAALK